MRTASYILHGLGIAAILSLLVFIFCEKGTEDERKLHGIMQQSLYKSRALVLHITKDNMESLSKNVNDYKNPASDRLWDIASSTLLQADTLLKMLDSIEKKPESPLLYEVQGKINLFRWNTAKKIEYDEYCMKHFPEFMPTDWLYKAKESGDPEHFKAVLELTRTKIGLINSRVICYCIIRTSGSTHYFDRFLLCIATDKLLNPKVGDTDTLNVFLSNYSRNYRLMKAYVNGIEVKLVDGQGKYQAKYDTPGIYPLNVQFKQALLNEDSTKVWEKTYLLRVGE